MFESLLAIIKNFYKNKQTLGIIDKKESLDLFLVEVYKNLQCSEAETQQIMRIIEELKMNDQFMYIRIQMLEA